jgi:hypothetical protein
LRDEIALKFRRVAFLKSTIRPSQNEKRRQMMIGSELETEFRSRRHQSCGRSVGDHGLVADDRHGRHGLQNRPARARVDDMGIALTVLLEEVAIVA